MMSSLDEDESLKDKRGLSSSPRCQSMAVKYVLVLICSFTQEIPSTFKTRSKQTRQQDMLLSMSVVRTAPLRTSAVCDFRWLLRRKL